MPDRRFGCKIVHTSPLTFFLQRGIGLETSILFASEGAHVLLVDINLENAEKGVDLILKRYPNVKAVATKVDVGKEVDVKAAVELAVQNFGRLDIMVGKHSPVTLHGLNIFSSLVQ